MGMKAGGPSYTDTSIKLSSCRPWLALILLGWVLHLSSLDIPHITNRTLSSYEENCPDTSVASIKSLRANSIRSVLGQIRTHFHMCAIQSYSASGRKFNLISLKIWLLSSNKFNQKMKLGPVNYDLVYLKRALLSTARGLQWLRSPRTSAPEASQPACSWEHCLMYNPACQCQLGISWPLGQPSLKELEIQIFSKKRKVWGNGPYWIAIKTLFRSVVSQ